MNKQFVKLLNIIYLLSFVLLLPFGLVAQDRSRTNIYEGKWHGIFKNYTIGQCRQYPGIIHVASIHNEQVDLYIDWPYIKEEPFVLVGTVSGDTIKARVNNGMDGCIYTMTFSNDKIEGDCMCDGFKYLSYSLTAEHLLTEGKVYNMRHTPPTPVKERIYYDENWYETSKDSAFYYRDVMLDWYGSYHGEFKDYYITGELQNKGFYEHGNMDDRIVWYFKSGQKMMAANYASGKFKVKKCWNKQGEVILKGGTGSYLFYNHNGDIITKRDYIKREVVGQQYSYHHNGSLAEIGYYKNGEYFVEKQYSLYGDTLKNGNGMLIYYHSNGVVRTKGKIVNGKREGEWIWQKRNGQIRAVFMYKNNSIIEKYMPTNFNKDFFVGKWKHNFSKNYIHFKEDNKLDINLGNISFSSDSVWSFYADWMKMNGQPLSEQELQKAKTTTSIDITYDIIIDHNHDYAILVLRGKILSKSNDSIINKVEMKWYMFPWSPNVIGISDQPETYIGPHDLLRRNK